MMNMAHIPTFLKLLIILIYTVFPILNPVFTSIGSKEVTYEHLGIPLEGYYTQGIRARTAWDVEIYDGKLFVGAGDYDANSGPVPIYCYDLQTGGWIHSGTVADEQADLFLILQDTLMVPGCDPRQDWTYGNIYRYEDGTWNTYRNIPGGIHQFDIAEYDGMLFVGLGVANGQYPIAVSYDGGQTFSQVTMYENGLPLDTDSPTGTSLQIRVYDFFILNDQLYAIYFRNDGTERTFHIYQYQNGAFHYYSDMKQSLTFRRTNYKLCTAKAELYGTMYLSTGNLYMTQDMITLTPISFGDHAIVNDLRVIDNTLYVCVISQAEDGQYRTSIWRKSDSGNQFRELFYFTFAAPAQSFTYNDGVFYFGMGDGTLSEYNEANGSILKVTYSLQ